MDKFIVIGVTSPLFISNEAKIINDILGKRIVEFIHIRKPSSSIAELENLIKGINPAYHKRLKIHDHFELLDEYDLGGIHLNSRNPKIYPKAKSVSISYHTMDEIESFENLDYFFISPIFDSISKKGYKGAFDLELLSNKIRGTRAIALGGVTPEKFDFLKSIGFYGAAMLGYFFPETKL